jgi:outer membrane lipoprotein
MRKRLIAAVPFLFLVTACAHYISEPSRALVDRAVTFGQLREAPDAFRGRVVMLGGVVAGVTPLPSGTRLEVIEHRLDSRELPSEVTPSEGRFLAVTGERLDPERYGQGALVTMVGEVTGTQSLLLEGKTYCYPLIAVKEIRDIVIEEMPNWGGPYGGK